jgi:predicted patatin/cPLA2 family phospholipase
MNLPRVFIPLIMVLVIASVGGCAARFKRNPVPQEFAATAQIEGLEGWRFTGEQAAGGDPNDFHIRAEIFAEQLRASGLDRQPIRYLAISGGGPQGAYGAGLLCGWTQRGTRPEFMHVTGISTGALTAPFAFLGPDYDHVLKAVYTTIETKDLIRKRSLLAALTSDAFSDTTGLYQVIQRYVTDDVLDAIAREHRRGRRLWIGTTNLDLMQPVYWNIGAIADSDLPNRTNLIHKVLLASASIPGAFPPVYFNVRAKDGNTYDEMHVDGGIATQVFAYPLTLDLKTGLDALGANTEDQKLFVIRNAKLAADYQAVKPRPFAIGGRSVTALIHTQGIGDLFRIYLGTVRDEIEFHLAYIPADFDIEPAEGFDPIYMSALFDLGYDRAKIGYPWSYQPPNFSWPDKQKWPEPSRR